MWFGNGKCSVWDMGWSYEQEFMEAYQHIHDMVKKALQSYDEDHM